MNFLKEIVKEKRAFIKQQKILNVGIKTSPISTKSRFKNILKKPGAHLIAEIKRASPSKGDLRPDLDIIEIARTYEDNGVKLVSVLTEEKFFKGSLSDIGQVSKNTSLSILCKDFILDSFQIQQAKAHGAEAILLIAKILSRQKLKELLRISKFLRMDAIVEIHNESDLRKIQSLIKDIEIIGINHRDLKDFSIDLDASAKLLPKIPKDKLIIAESGISSVSDIKRLKDLGVNGILVGESLMREKDIAKKIREFTSVLL